VESVSAVFPQYEARHIRAFLTSAKGDASLRKKQSFPQMAYVRGKDQESKKTPPNDIKGLPFFFVNIEGRDACVCCLEEESGGFSNLSKLPFFPPFPRTVSHL
jgi:hypothetical protein